MKGEKPELKILVLCGIVRLWWQLEYIEIRILSLAYMVSKRQNGWKQKPITRNITVIRANAFFPL